MDSSEAYKGRQREIKVSNAREGRRREERLDELTMMLRSFELETSTELPGERLGEAESKSRGVGLPEGAREGGQRGGREVEREERSMV